MRKFLSLALLCPLFSMCQPITIKGTVITEEGTPIQGATVTLIRSTNNDQKSTTTTPNTQHQTPNNENIQTVITNATGSFTIHSSLLTDSLRISAIGYTTVTEPNNERGLITIILKRSVTELDDVVVIGYGTTTRRLATGNVSRVSATEIARQPVANPLAALEGRIPGLTVSSSSGLPGASVNIQLRGQNSLTQGSEPLFIIDGVPFAPGNNSVNRLPSILSTQGAGLSPFASINPADIESIEVLKDADATAIYGSRGANGVVLITTKKSKGGKTAFTLNTLTGWGTVTRTTPMLNTTQYLQMRREAFANDGQNPTAANAPDLLLWDTTRYTNFTELLTGGTARNTDVQAALTGGSASSNFLVRGSYNRQTTVFPGSMNDTRGSLLANLHHTAPSQNFTADLSVQYAVGKSSLAAAGLAGLINLPPNTPELYTADGSLNWEQNDGTFNNPLAYLKRSYTAVTDNMVSRMGLSYRLLPSLYLKTSMGYNVMNVGETLLTPIAAQNPATNPKGSNSFGANHYSGWIVEPQATYGFKIGASDFDLLLGSTLLQNFSKGSSISGTGYSNDALLHSLEAAPAIAYHTNSKTEYSYAAFFGRIGYNLKNTYLLNLTGRRDASSRFGPGNRWASFGAVGTAWLWSNEAFIKKALPFISYGKIRGSYGTTGNDQIGDYNYFDAWGVVPPYNGTTALYPAALFNAAYGWEINKKLEAALDLGFFNNRFLLSLTWYQNRSSNQLVQYALPSQTGFNGITDNFPALVQNRGWEVELSTMNINTKGFTWSSSFNITVPKNKLIAFPGLESSPYAATYVLGQPLTVIHKLKATGVDPATGIFTFENWDDNPAIQIPRDYQPLGYLGPRFFGGLGNTFSFKGIEAHLFFVFKKQWGGSYLNSLYTAGIIPGGMNNQPLYVLDRWRHPGDITDIQRFTAITSGPAYAAVSRFRSSNGVYADASFARLKTTAVSYNLPPAFLAKYKVQAVRIYLQAQNLFTFTNYKGADPENQNLLALPPLKTIAAGIQFTF